MVGKVVVFCPVELSVVGTVFAEKVGAMRCMKCVHPEPAGHLWVDLGGVEEGCDLGAGVVVVTSAEPFAAHLDPVGGEGLCAARPHASGGMIAPAVVWVGQGVEDLQGFDALFAEARTVEALRGSRKVWVWKERLNGSLLCCA